MTRVVVNFLLFQACWFACVLAGVHGWPYLSVVAAAALLAWHLSRAPRPATELAMVALVVALGTAFDSLLAASGWLVYASPVPWAGLAPVWIVSLWACFATLPNVSLRWLKPRPVVAALLGGAGGPLAYLGGAALGGVMLASPGPALAALAIGWALVTPLVLRIAAWLDGWAPVDDRGHALAGGH